MHRVVVSLVALLVPVAPAAAEDLTTFLTAATAAARPNVPLRADGELTTTSPDGTVGDQIAILRRPNGDVYIELRNSGVRALLLGDGKTALLVPGKGKSAAAFALDTQLGGSEFTREDLQPFNASPYRSPIIVDRNPGELTVSLTPSPPSQYALQVMTFDSERKAPLVVKDYKDTVSNLVKVRRSTQHTTVGDGWQPGEITMENFPMRSTSTLRLHWWQIEDVPALFDPAALGKPSALSWPAVTPGSAANAPN
jgi:hypothetical protein